MSKKKMQYCANCGAELGEGFNFGPESCGDRECDRAVRDGYEAEREEAHEQLDRDLGYY